MNVTKRLERIIYIYESKLNGYAILRANINDRFRPTSTLPRLDSNPNDWSADDSISQTLSDREKGMLAIYKLALSHQYEFDNYADYVDYIEGLRGL